MRQRIQCVQSCLWIQFRCMDDNIREKNITCESHTQLCKHSNNAIYNTFLMFLIVKKNINNI